MLSVITERRKIEKAQKHFLSALKLVLTECEVRHIGYQGAHEEVNVYLHSQINVCFSSAKLENRFWNPFMLLNAASGRSIGNITVEINFPFELNRSIAGIFLENDNGEIFIGHRGIVGGGCKGIGKNDFMRFYKGHFEYVEDGDRQTEVIVISALNSPFLVKNINAFVEIVDSFKYNVSFDEQENQNNYASNNASEESEHRTTYELSALVDAEMLHAKVVNTIMRQLQKKGYSTGNTREIDLYITERNNYMTHLFEVKSSSDTQSIYTAIGQLEYHNAKQKNTAKKIVVLPNDISDDKKRVLEKLDIELVCFSIVNDNIRFTDLNKAVALK